MDKQKLSLGQIATILTLIIAAIFVFAVITLNMRRVTQRKTVIDNAVDGSALFLASSLGSFGNKLSQEYLKGGTKDCTWDVPLIANMGLLILSLLATIFIPGSGLAGVALTVANIARAVAVGVAITSGLGLGAQYAHILALEPTQFAQVSLYFKQMTAEQQLAEGAIQYAVFSAIDDPTEVEDIYDDDGDGYKNDKILRLTQAYYQRLRGLPSLSAKISAFFIGQLKRINGQGFVSYQEDSDTWKLEKVLLSDPQIEPRKFTEWLSGILPGDFMFLLALLDQTGYGVSFKQEVPVLISEIGEFEKWADALLQQSPDMRLAGFSQWYYQLIPPDPKDPNDMYWQDRLALWQVYLTKWIVELEAIQGRVQACLDGCENNIYDCCEVCCNDDGCWCCRYGCCGEWRDCCRICGDPCAPGQCCNTCCLIQDNCDRSTSKIVRALEDHLIPFKAKLDVFVASLSKFKSEVDSYYKDIREKGVTWGYVWNDTLGEHKVVVAIKDPKEEKPFELKLPYLAPDREWLVRKCMNLKNAKGAFRFMVSRYDNEKAEGLKGILDLLKWDRTITSEVRASYGITKEEIKIEEKIK